MLNTFEMRYSTIKRDSALLDGYARERATIEALDDAWAELKCLGALAEVVKSEQRGKHPGCGLHIAPDTRVRSRTKKKPPTGD